MIENMQHKNSVWESIKVVASPLLIIILSCGTSLYYLRHNPEQLLVFDDSYITLKFASHLFDYGSITYDGSSYLTGATSPLHIVLIALLGLFLKIETASLVIGIICFVLSALLVYRWTLKMFNDRNSALLAGLLMSTSGWLIFDALNGLETTTFIFCSLLTLYCFSLCEDRPLYIIPLFLSILTRPEGWFLAAALWMWQLIRSVTKKNKHLLRNLLTSIGIFMLLIIPYFLLSLYYTGSLVPGTAFSKFVFFAEVRWPLLYRTTIFKERFLLFYKELFYPIPLLIFPLMLFARRLFSFPSLWLYFGFFYVFYFVLFPGAIDHYWCRYQHIFIPFILIALSLGTAELLKLCTRNTVRVAVGVVIASSLIYNQVGSFMNVEKIYSSEIRCTKNTMLDLALWLKNNTPEDSLIALHDIGVVGYFSGRKLLDLVGIINPEMSKQYWNNRLKIPLEFKERNVIAYLKEKKPDYLVMLPEWDRFFNLLKPTNRNYFELLYTTAPLYPTQMKYHVFKCNWGL